MCRSAGRAGQCVEVLGHVLDLPPQITELQLDPVIVVVVVVVARLRRCVLVVVATDC
jgi:hypothetical protein